MAAYHPYSMSLPVCLEILKICWLQTEAAYIGKEKMVSKQDESTEGWESCTSSEQCEVEFMSVMSVMSLLYPPFVILSFILTNYPSYIMGKVGRSRNAFSEWGGGLVWRVQKLPVS